MKKELIDIAKSNSFLSLLLSKLKGQGKFSFDDLIFPVGQYVNMDNQIRINLVLPTLRKSCIFGGISTAISFFSGLINSNFIQGRILITDNEHLTRWTYDISSQIRNVEVVFLADRKPISIHKNDVFLFSSWRTAYVFNDIVKRQKESFGMNRCNIIYLIQDYEPGFSAWSTKFALSESTYRENSSDIIAVFNSRELKEFFDNHGYQFREKLYFSPLLNAQLKSILLDKKNIQLEKQRKILIYGRPNVERNAFELIVESLKMWSQSYCDAHLWQIVSLGEKHIDIELNGTKIISKGKVSITEYAEEMLNAYAGISLMISPHPSYPPLEMSTFGIKTITNSYENKNLEYFNENIISIDSLSPARIANELQKLCDNYDSGLSKFAFNKEYLDGNDFVETIDRVRKMLTSMAKEE